MSTIHSAIVFGNKTQIAHLLARGTNVDALDHNGQTALHLAIGIGKASLVEPLLDHGASACIQNNEKNTAYDLAKTRSDPKIVYLIQDRQNQRSLAVCAYEVAHLFDCFRVVFTHGVTRWSDADILLLGEWHDRADLTRGFVSNFAPAERLLVCIEGTPSMRPVTDSRSIKSLFFDHMNMHRQAKFIGWDAQKHLMPQGNSIQLHCELLYTQNMIINEVDSIFLELGALSKHYCSFEIIKEELSSCNLDQLDKFVHQYQRIKELCNQFDVYDRLFIKQGSSNPLDHLKSVQVQSHLLIEIIERGYSLKIEYPSSWKTVIGENEFHTLSIKLSKVSDRLQLLYSLLEPIQNQLSKGVATNKQVRETFPARTAALVSTIRNIGQRIDRGMTGKTVLVAGALHLWTSMKYNTKPEYCLDSFYKELLKHKVAVVSQTGY